MYASHQPQLNKRPGQGHSLARILLWVALALYMIGIWVLSGFGSAVTGYIAATGIPDLFWHLGLYAGLCVLAIAAIHNTWLTQATWLSALEGALVAVSYSLLDEIHQHFVPGRGTDAQDIAGNLIGVALAVACVLACEARKGR